jgi:hypothetical protein
MERKVFRSADICLHRASFDGSAPVCRLAVCVGVFYEASASNKVFRYSKFNGCDDVAEAATAFAPDFLEALFAGKGSRRLAPPLIPLIQRAQGGVEFGEGQAAIVCGHGCLIGCSSHHAKAVADMFEVHRLIFPVELDLVFAEALARFAELLVDEGQFLIRLYVGAIHIEQLPLGLGQLADASLHVGDALLRRARDRRESAVGASGVHDLLDIAVRRVERLVIIHAETIHLSPADGKEFFQ